MSGETPPTGVIPSVTRGIPPRIVTLTGSLFKFGRLAPVSFMEPAPLPPPMPRPNWFERNWKWVVPVGCLLPVLLVGRMRAHGFLFCNRSNETIRCLQNRAGPRASELGCDRSDRLPDFANRNRLWQQQRKWTNRRSEPIDPAEWPERESYALCRSEEIGRSLDVSNHGH